MTKLTLSLIFTLATSAHAEVYPSELFHRLGAGVVDMFAGTYYWQRAMERGFVFRPPRVPLADVHACGDDACVILNGQKVDLEPTPESLIHGRVQVVGVSRQKDHTGVYARVRFGSWVTSEPIFLHVWAVIRHAGRPVEIQGYGIQHEGESGSENERLVSLGDYSLLKFLTSQNAVEVEVARELIGRRVFCVKYPADPIESIRDDVAPLEAHDLIADREAQTRLSELNAVAAVIDRDHGRSKCETPMTDQIDIVLDQVREALHKSALKLVTKKEIVKAKETPNTPETPSTPEPIRTEPPAPTVEVPAPSPAPPTEGIPFLHPPRPKPAS